VARPIDPRTRPALLGAAHTLFASRGIAATGVDDVARVSGLAKPTLYRHFPTKDVLLLAYLDDRHARLNTELRSWVEAAAPRRRPRAVIDWLCDWIARPDFAGCSFVRAYAERHADQRIREKARRRKRAMRATIDRACRQAGVRAPATLSAQLALIVEGATTLAFVTGDSADVAAAARALAEAVLRPVGVWREE
jgi:AcrR family transcriptional regulator